MGETLAKFSLAKCRLWSCRIMRKVSGKDLFQNEWVTLSCIGLTLNKQGYTEQLFLPLLLRFSVITRTNDSETLLHCVQLFNINLWCHISILRVYEPASMQCGTASQLVSSGSCQAAEGKAFPSLLRNTRCTRGLHQRSSSLLFLTLTWTK